MTGKPSELWSESVTPSPDCRLYFPHPPAGSGALDVRRVASGLDRQSPQTTMVRIMGSTLPITRCRSLSAGHFCRARQAIYFRAGPPEGCIAAPARKVVVRSSLDRYQLLGEGPRDRHLDERMSLPGQGPGQGPVNKCRCLPEQKVCLLFFLPSCISAQRASSGNLSPPFPPFAHLGLAQVVDIANFSPLITGKCTNMSPHCSRGTGTHEQASSLSKFIAPGPGPFLSCLVFVRVRGEV